MISQDSEKNKPASYGMLEFKNEKNNGFSTLQKVQEENFDGLVKSGEINIDKIQSIYSSSVDNSDKDLDTALNIRNSLAKKLGKNINVENVSISRNYADGSSSRAEVKDNGTSNDQIKPKVTNDNYVVSAEYVENNKTEKAKSFRILNLPDFSSKDVEKSGKNDLFFIDDVPYSKAEYQKITEEKRKNGDIDLFYKLDVAKSNRSIYFANTKNFKKAKPGKKFNIKFTEEQFKKHKEKFDKQNADVSKIPATEWVKPAGSQSSPWIIGVGARKQPSSVSGVKFRENENVKYYLDDKLINVEKFRSLKPDSIKSLDVIKDKTTKNGGSIYIISK